MNKINQDLIREVIEPYQEASRVLKSADFEYPLIRGSFLVGPTNYYSTSFEHLTDIEIQLCLNQLSYVAVAEMMKRGMIAELRTFNFKELQQENMLIIESRKRFRRHIRREMEISGDLKFTRQKKRKNILLSSAEFQFENQSCVGHLELAVIIPEVKK
jgi:hypothetical protein